MKVTLEPTETIVRIGLMLARRPIFVPARLWKGQTAKGARIYVVSEITGELEREYVRNRRRNKKRRLLRRSQS